VPLVCQFARMSRKYHAHDGACVHHLDNILRKGNKKLALLKVKPFNILLYYNKFVYLQLDDSFLNGGLNSSVSHGIQGLKVSTSLAVTSFSHLRGPISGRFGSRNDRIFYLECGNHIVFTLGVLDTLLSSHLASIKCRL
jgi:hypothetical protein